jgi:tryptophan halogenase
MIGQGIVPAGYHPLVDAVPDAELAKLGESVRGVIASCVTAMPTHEQFIDRFCKAPVAA